MYVNKIYVAGDYVLVKNYTPKHFGGPGKKRSRKMKDTPQAMAKYNNRKRAEKLQLLMLMNFEKGYHLTLDYPLGNRPETYEEAERILTKFLYKMSRRLKKKERAFKYIAITERGHKREALHHHMIVEGDPNLLAEITQVWGCHIKLSQMYDEGAYKKLAEYICKIETKEEQTKGKSKYHRSRNLKEPTIRTRIVSGSISDEPYVPKGYELLSDSYHTGFNEVIGIRYQRYLCKRIQSVKSQVLRKKSKSEQKGNIIADIFKTGKRLIEKWRRG